MIVWKGVMRPGSTSGRFWMMRPIIKAVGCVAARKTWQQLAANRPGAVKGLTTRACLTAHVGSHSSRAARTSQLRRNVTE